MPGSQAPLQRRLQELRGKRRATPIRISLCIPDCCWDLQPKTLVVSLFLCLPNTLQVSGSPQDR